MKKRGLFDWSKQINPRREDVVPPISFRNNAQKRVDRLGNSSMLTAQGTPDIKALRADFAERMKRMRRGLK
jgi:hypothetical protein